MDRAFRMARVPLRLVAVRLNCSMATVSLPWRMTNCPLSACAAAAGVCAASPPAARTEIAVSAT